MKDTRNVTEYIKLLKLQIEKPSLNYLEQICQAHLNTFPFENISKLLYFREKQYPIPTLEQFIENFKEHNFGGTCYTLNSNLMLLLKELGFQCYHVKLGKVHIGIMVIIENEHYYVDCGAAAPFLKPARLDKNKESTTQFGDDRVHLVPVKQKEHEFEYIRYTGGKQIGEIWPFHTGREYKLHDFQPTIETSNKPGSTFMSILRCHLYQTNKKRSISLVNNKLVIRYANGETQITRLSAPEKIKTIVEEEFNLPKLPIIEALQVLKDLNIDIFSKNK